MDRIKGWCEKKLTRENMIVLALSGLLIMIIAIPVKGEKNIQEPTEKTGLSDRETGMINIEETAFDMEGPQALEQRLEAFLSCLDGAGRVRVMITFAASGQQVVEKDMPFRTESTSENDAGGGSRSITGKEQQESTVYTTDQSGVQHPYVKQTLAAQVEGVTVLAQGGSDPVVQKEITGMIEALFGIEPHKIRVAKLKETKKAEGSRK